MTTEQAYGILRRLGETNLDHLGVTAGVLRRRAAQDGLRVTQSTTTDYMGRKTRLIAVTDSAGLIAYAP